MILFLAKGLILSRGGDWRGVMGMGNWARWPGEGRLAGAGGAGVLPLAGTAVTSQAATRKAVRQAPPEAEQMLPSCLKDCSCEWKRLTTLEAGMPQGRACVFKGPSTDTFLPSGAQATRLPLEHTLQKVHT